MADDNKDGGTGLKGNSLAKAEGAMQLAFAVPVGCFVGMLIGAGLDRHFHTKWIVVLGLFLGAAGGFIQIFTAAMRSGRGGDQ